jgi:two-component system, NtrC family, sensor kinase
VESLINFIQNTNASEEEKNALYKELKNFQKRIDVAEFKYNRTNMDKDAITNVLNATIEDLNKQKEIIESSRNLIELKNTELNSAMDLIKSAQSQLVQSEKMASLGQLTAGVAHEINNPINFVSANIKPLKDDVEDLLKCITMYDEQIAASQLEHHFEPLRLFQKKLDMKMLVDEINGLLKGIEVGAARTTEIVKGLRNFSRLDQSDLKKANINEGIESTLVLLHSFYKDRITVVKNFGEIPEIDCYPGQLNQVFMNILSNSIQAIDEQGMITITTALLPDQLMISIIDNGHGMSEEVRKKIFDPFFTTKEVGKGTGLGLSITYGIIEKHNGKIEVKSEIGKGTEFIIYLPLKNNKT